jgi:hypothetical protein
MPVVSAVMLSPPMSALVPAVTTSTPAPKR